jgi:hypothetical protein
MTVFINCRVSPGLFNTEYYVVVDSSGYFVSRMNVRVNEEPLSDRPVAGKVLGYFIERDKDRTLVQLPGEAVVGGLRTWVDNTAVSAA